MVSHCLLGFAQRINAVPRGEWKAIIDTVPELCDKGCGQSCREVCKRYARMQWHLVGGRKPEYDSP